MPTWSIVHSRTGSCRSTTSPATSGSSRSTAAATGAPTARPTSRPTRTRSSSPTPSPSWTRPAPSGRWPRGCRWARASRCGSPSTHPDRVIGLCLFGSTIPVNDRKPDDPDVGPDVDFDQLEPDDEGWHKYNAHYWRRDWPGFAAWFSGEALFTERHSTKAVEDTVGWVLETDPETMITAERAPYLVPPADWERRRLEGYGRAFLRRVRCPALVVHGSDDHIMSIGIGRRVAEALGATYVEIEGGGHSPIGREPVLVEPG